LHSQVSYLDTGLSSSYFTEADQLLVTPNGGSPSTPASLTTPTPRTNRRYKTQLRDFLSTCRSKRKSAQPANSQQSSIASPASNLGQLASPSPASVVDYIPDPAAAVAVAYSNLNPMYPSSPVPYGPSTADNIYMSQSIHSGSFYPSAENLFHQYRLQGSYYPEYHHPHHHHHHHSPYVANGFIPYDSYGLTSPSVVNAKEEKWHEDKYYEHSTNGRHNFNYESSSAHQHSPVISATTHTNVIHDKALTIRRSFTTPSSSSTTTTKLPKHRPTR